MASDAPEFTELVRQFRKRRTRARGRRLAYPVYVAALALLIYGGPAIVRGADSLKTAHHADLTTYRIDAAAPYALIGVGLLVLVGLSRQALWRGPVVMSEADAAWILPLPVSRRRLMLPRYFASAVLTVLVAIILGLLGAVVLHAYALGSNRALVPAVVEYAVGLGLLGLGIGAATERSEEVASLIRTARGPVVVITAALAALAAHAAAHRPSPSAAGLTHYFGPAARITLGLLAVTAAGYGLKAAPDIPSIALRRRAEVGSAVSTATHVADMRRARLAVHSATHGRTVGLRLRPPRRSLWAIPWRDLNNVLSAPGSFGWAAAWIALGSGAFAVAARQSLDSRREVLPLVVSMLCGYLAALPYTEPVRLDADDFRRIRWSPYPIRSLTARHTAVPIVLGSAGQVIGTVIAAIWLHGQNEALALCVALTTGPVVAVAALISAFRGGVPLQLIFGSPDIGFGSIGPVLLVVWYLLGPIAAILLGGLTALPAVHAYHVGSSAAGAAIESILISSTATITLVWWARQRAAQRYAE